MTTIWINETFAVKEKELEKKRSRSYSELVEPTRQKRSSFMMDLDTFLTTRDAMVDDFGQSELE